MPIKIDEDVILPRNQTVQVPQAQIEPEVIDTELGQVGKVGVNSTKTTEEALPTHESPWTKLMEPPQAMDITEKVVKK
jgi:hypothetical protein